MPTKSVDSGAFLRRVSGRKFEVDGSILVGDPLDMSYLGAPDPVRKQAEVHVVVYLVPNDLERTCIREVPRSCRGPFECFRLGEGTGADGRAIRSHQGRHHPSFIRVRKDTCSPAAEWLDDAVALHLHCPVDELPAAYQIVHGATLSLLARLGLTPEGRRHARTTIGVASGAVNGRTIALTIVGFLIGVLAAGSIGVRVIEEVRTDEDATSLPPENVSSTTLPPLAYFVDPNETLVASTAVVPVSVEGSGSALAISYDLVSLAPTEGLPPIRFATFGQSQEISNSDLPVIYPRSWIVSTEFQTIEGGPSDADVRVARFILPEGVAAADIVSADIIDPLIAFPLETMFELSETSRSTTIIDGVQAELLNISEQTDATIVQIELLADDPNDLTFSIEGSGAGWRSAVFEAEGRPRVNLTWVGGDLPDVMKFKASGIQWVPFVGSYPILIGGFG